MKRYRIAVFHNLPPGGALRALVSWAEILSRFGDIDLYHMRGEGAEQLNLDKYVKNEYACFYRPLAVCSRPLRYLRFIINIINYFRYTLLSLKIARKINNSGCDFVFMDLCMYYHLGPLSLFARPPVFSFLHEYYRMVFDPAVSEKSLRGRLMQVLNGPYRVCLRTVNKLCVRKLSYVMCNSKYSGAMLKNIYGISPELNYLWADERVFYYDPAVKKEYYYLTVGVLHEIKGFAFLLEALARLPENIRYPLYLITPYLNDYAETLKQAAERQNVRLIILSALTDAEVAGRYRGAFLTLFAPEKEPFGYVPIESMSCGTPVIGVAEGGLQETILDGKTGFLCRRDPADFAGKIRQLADDEKLYGAFRDDCLKWADEMWTGAKGRQRMEESMAKMLKRLKLKI